MNNQTTFEEMKPRHLLMLRWLRDKKDFMEWGEIMLFDFLLTQRSLNGYQEEELTKIYSKVRIDHQEKSKYFPKGIYEIERFESCGMVG